MTRTAALYCRISRDRVGAGLGVERQETECRELAARLGWTVATVHVDNDISAYSGKPRPGYRALLADVAAGRVGAVLAWHSDRLHRSTVELEEYIEVCGAIPTSFVKAGPLDLSTASGRMTARIMGAVSRQEVEHIIERVRGQKIQAALAGDYRGGRRPFGFEADGLTVRPAEAAAVIDASTRVLHGESLASVAREWNAAGLTTSTGGTWTPESLRNMLTKPRNCALIELDGRKVPARWPALVSEEIWRALRVLLADPARRTNCRGSERRWLGSGLFRCGLCGDATTVRTGSAGTGRPVYRCRASGHLNRAAPPVDGFVTEIVLDRLARPDARLLLTIDSGTDTAPLADEAAALRVRSGELVELFTDGAITKADLAQGKAKITVRLAELAAAMVDAAAGSPLAGFADSDDVAATWEAATVSRRKAVIDALMTVTLSAPGRGARRFDPTTVEITHR